jgi:hypothetical protein
MKTPATWCRNLYTEVPLYKKGKQKNQLWNPYKKRLLSNKKLGKNTYCLYAAKSSILHSLNYPPSFTANYLTAMVC